METMPATVMEPEAAKLIGAWPDLVTDVVAANNARTHGTIGRAASIVDGRPEESSRLDGESGFEIPSVPLYQETKDFTCGIYSQPLAMPAKDENAVLICKDDGVTKPAGGWAIEDYTRPDGSLWLRGYYRTGDGRARWIGSNEGVIPRALGRADLIWLRKIADEVSLWSGSRKFASITLDVGQQQNNAPLRIGMYRPGAGHWSGLVQLAGFYSGTLRGAEAARLRKPVSIDIAPPKPACYPCEVDQGTVIKIPDNVVEYRINNATANARFLLCKEGENHRVVKMPLRTGDQIINYMISGGRGGCMCGGAVIGTQPLDQRRSYDSFGNSKIVMLGNDAPCDDFTIEGMRGHNVWDGITLGQRGASRATIRGWYLTWVRDDAIENDNRYPGLKIEECLFDGVFVGYSSRNVSDRDGSSHSATIAKSAIRLAPMAGPPRPPEPGHAIMFKLDAKSPRLKIYETVLAWEQGTSLPISSAGAECDDPLYDLSPDRYRKLEDSKNVTICYLGEGGYPRAWWVPDGWKVLTGSAAKSCWGDVVEAWRDAHPLVYRIPGVDP